MRALVLSATCLAVLAVDVLSTAVEALAQEPPGEAVLPAPLVDTEWRLVRIDDRAPDPDLPPVTLTLGASRAEGSGGCNWYTAWLEEHAGTVAVSHLAVTGRDCLHPRIMDLEARYLADLEDFTVYRWTGYVLALMADENENGWLLFTREGRPPPR